MCRESTSDHDALKSGDIGQMMQASKPTRFLAPNDISLIH